MKRPAVMLITAACLLAPAARGVAQGPVLPSLGDAAGDTLSLIQERRVGERIMSELRRSDALIEDRELTSALNRFGRRLLASTRAAGHDFEFFLVRDSSLNAFALPGGFVGVHSGLAIAAQTESELASVIAHEIGHVTQRHIARMLAQNRQSSLISLAAVVAAIVAAGASEGQAAAGLVALGGSVHEQQMLAFSREAEREADRVGLELLRDAGFKPDDMISFFSRMQRATRVYESGAPAYLRTHPLTSERMADIRNRLGEMSPLMATGPGLDFLLMRAKLVALAGSERRDRLQAGQVFKDALTSASGLERVAALYGSAVVALELERIDDAAAALQQARATLAGQPGAGGDHPFLASLQTRITLARDGPEAALATLALTLKQFPDEIGLRLLHADLLLRSARNEQALIYLEGLLEGTRSDPDLWRLLAEARDRAGLPGQAHWAMAERYALLGGWAAAIEQLTLAGRDPGLSYYDLSKIDVRRKEFESELRREREER